MPFLVRSDQNLGRALLQENFCYATLSFFCECRFGLDLDVHYCGFLRKHLVKVGLLLLTSSGGLIRCAWGLQLLDDSATA